MGNVSTFAASRARAARSRTSPGLAGIGSALALMACLALLSSPLHGQAAGSAVRPGQAGPWRNFPQQPTAPAGAPNVLLVMTDDVGFSASSTFGGPIPTPNLDSVARAGLRFNRFHVTAMCSPTRAALLTGRNHHAVGYGAISNVAIDEPGYTSVMPKSAATIGAVLKANGYDTSFFGKNHNTPDWEAGPMGPFDRWPNAWGFDYFYGFNGPATDQFNPELVENRNPIRRDPSDADYFLERDVTDHMIEWLHTQHSLGPDKPWLLYYAPETMHGPQQAPADWIARFAGRFDSGWDAVREATFARQKVLGIVPGDAMLAPRPPGIPAWTSLGAVERRNATRLMEVAAAQLAFLDDQFGRVLDTLRETGQLENTLILFIQGDNGAALHELGGSINVYESFAQIEESAEALARNLQRAGGEDSYGNYPAGWAFAMNTPFPWGKAIASHLGGIRNGLVVSWPRRISERGAIRTQYGHVIDIAPTLYAAIGIRPPDVVDGVTQQPIDGISMLDAFIDPAAPSPRREQYFEMLGTRGIYRDGWLAGTAVTWQPWSLSNYDPLKLEWELYNLDQDFSQTRNLAAAYPEKLAELRSAFETAARSNNVYPLASDYLSRLNPKNRPEAIAAAAQHVFYPGDTRFPIAAWPNVSRQWRAVTRLTTRSAKDSGPLFVMGMRFTGYGLVLEKGVPVFTYNPTGRPEERLVVRAPRGLTSGEHAIEVNFVPQGSGVRLSLSVDGSEVAVTGSERFHRVFAGNALIGRPAIDDRSGPRECACTIRDVTVTSR